VREKDKGKKSQKKQLRILLSREISGRKFREGQDGGIKLDEAVNTVAGNSLKENLIGGRENFDTGETG